MLNISKDNLNLEAYVSSAYKLNVFRKKIDTKTINFIDAFSGNDIVSVKIIQKKALNDLDCSKPLIALFNNRKDRLHRMLSFASFFAAESGYDYIFLVGDSQKFTKRCFNRNGCVKPIEIIRNRNPAQIMADIIQKIPSNECNIVGMGNYRGMGRKLLNFLKDPGEI